MAETFPRRPLLDRIIVREIPIAEYYEQPEGVTIDLDNAHIETRSDRGVVVAVSHDVESVAVGDTVFFDEFALSDPVYLNPAHKNRSDLPKYWLLRVPDLKGVQIPRVPHSKFVTCADCDETIEADHECFPATIHA